MSNELTSGVPGTGKTMFNVKEIMELEKKGENIYLVDMEGDFPGLNVTRLTRNQKIIWLELEDGSRIKQIDGEYIKNINTAAHQREIPIRFDWRDCEDGSYIFVDEAHYTYPASSNYSMEHVRDDIKDLSTHRHRGMNIRLISQSPHQLHWYALKQVTLYRHLVRVRGKEESKVLVTDHYVEHKPNPDDADHEVFKFDDSTHGVYKSAQFHDKRKTRWDSKTKKMVKFGSFMAVLVLINAVYLYNKNPWGLWGNEAVAAERIVSNEQIQTETPSEKVTLQDIKTPLRLEEIKTDESTILVSEQEEIPFGCILKTETRGVCFYKGRKEELHYIDYLKESRKMLGSNDL